MVLRKTSLHRRRSIKGQRCLQFQYYQNRSHIEAFFYKRPNPCSSLGGLRMTTRRHFFIPSMEWRETKRGHVSTISTPVLTSLTPRVSPGKLWASVAKSGYLGLTAHALLSIQKFLLLLYLLHRGVWCCFGIRTELEKEPLKNFQVSKAPVVAAEKIPLKVGSQI